MFPACLPCLPTILGVGKQMVNIFAQIALFRLISSFHQISRNPLFIGLLLCFSPFSQAIKSDPAGVWQVGESVGIMGSVGKRICNFVLIQLGYFLIKFKLM